jgi:hydrogenase-4 component B
MEIALFIAALLILLAGGIAAAVFSASRRLPAVIGVSSVLVAGVLGTAAATSALWAARTIDFTRPMSIPFASFALRMDALAAFFLIVIFLISSLAAIYGSGYLRDLGSNRKRGFSWLFFNSLILGMALVVTSANGVLFIIAWETMSFAAFFLVTYEDEKAGAQKAGYIYLIAAHIGVVFLFMMFWIFAAKTGGSMNFSSFAQLAFADTKTRGILFLLSIIGFGAKAGFIPLHVWLPEAHPAAPSHVSALMSGVMIKMGIYGLLRTLTFLGTPPVWWGSLLVVIGLVSGLLGVLFALAQHDLKRLLAYHSVENIGIIAIGLGLGLLGMAHQNDALIVLGFGGGILHVLNHSIFKSLLFMGAGSVLHQAHTKEIDLLGGLIKKMPITAVTFLIAAAAISGLPFLNGFVSEFFIYSSSFLGVTGLSKEATVLPLASLLGLAAIGGLAVACFTKAVGIIFLGEARSAAGSRSGDPNLAMRLPMILLAVLCVAIGIAPLLVLPITKPAIAVASGLSFSVIDFEIIKIVKPFVLIMALAVGVLAAFTGLFFLRRKLLAGRQITKSLTWDCGYTAPNSRMQYTASSFVQPVVDGGGWILRTRRKESLPQGYFPKTAKFATHTDDTFIERLFRPLFAGIGWLFGKLQWMQHGRISLYILYIAIALLALLFWFGGLR